VSGILSKEGQMSAAHAFSTDDHDDDNDARMRTSAAEVEAIA